MTSYKYIIKVRSGFMVGELPADGQCSVCGGKVGIIQEEQEKNRGTPGSPQMYLETWEIAKCSECGYVENKKLLKSEKLT